MHAWRDDDSLVESLVEKGRGMMLLSIGVNYFMFLLFFGDIDLV